MKILAGRKFFEQFGDRAELVCPECKWALLEQDGSWSGPADDAEAAVLISDAYCQQFKDQILASPSIKWVHTENTGVDAPFYRELLEKGILLTRSSGANAPEVAEFAFGMILWATKCFGKYFLQQQSGLWERHHHQSLSDKTLLMLGLGAIGSRVVRIANSFGMHVLGIRKSGRPLDGVHEQGILVDLPAFLPRADIIVLALPLSPETELLIRETELSLMKETAIFVNVARGQMVDISALKKHLLQQPKMHACLDVFPSEPLQPDDELWTFPNVLITPHIAFSSPLYRPRAAEIWLENLEMYLQGMQLENIVT